MLIASPDYPAGRLAWFNAYRGKGDDAVNAFLHNFGDSWLKFCSAKRGNTHVAVKLTREQIEALQFIKPRFE
jgi:hypothetical protein